ncbi:MAG TPA: T9SS type A sorting domain-containing protein [Flavobacterium sp.]|nr:T9SS type A sorting domain-containing protein [Flavobacterium sp.]
MKKSLLLFLFITSISLQAQNFWTEVAPFASNAEFPVSQIAIADANVVWVSGGHFDPVNLQYTTAWSRSVDGGVTWTEGNIDLGNSILSVSSMFAVSETTVYVTAFVAAAGADGGVYVTHDSGATWTEQPTAAFDGITSFPNFIHFWDASHGITAGDPESGYFEIYTTSDAGAHWTRIPEANIPAPLQNEYGYSLYFETRGNAMWFGTNFGRIYKSNDMGVNWTVSQGPIADFASAFVSGSFSFKNQNDGLLISNDWQFYRTSDGGATWNPDMSTTGVIRNRDVVFVPETNNTYFSWGSDIDTETRGSSYSTDGGMTWQDLNTVDDAPVEPHAVEFKSGMVGFCVGNYLGESEQRFFRLTDPLNRLLKNDGFAAKAKFTAVPNPTTGLVKLSGAEINSVLVFDLSGKVVKTESFNSLNEVTLNLSTFQNGVYFAKIIADNGTSFTLKIVKN